MVAQSPAQPSSESRLPSSHTSLPTRNPSPQTSAHELSVVKEPPEHEKPVSTTQVGPQPSPPTVLLSSQPSAKGPQVTRRPSPQIGAHVSTPPMPEPSAIDDVHDHPVSTRHSESR